MKVVMTSTALLLASQLSFAQSFSTDPNGVAGSTTPTFPDRGLAVQLVQNTALTITALNSVSCNAGGLHTDNSYMRRFDLDGDHALVAPFELTSVDVGVETATGNGGTQPIEIRAYSIPNASTLTFGNLTMVGSIATTIADTSETLENFVVSAAGVNPSTHDLVVEVFTPEGQTNGHSFFIGSNDLGEIAPSYLAAADCGITEPTTTGTIGFPNMQIVLVANGTSGEPYVRPEPIPTMGVWGTAALVFALMLAGAAVMRRRS